MNELKDQLIDLQTRLAYQEDTLRQLDAVTIRGSNSLSDWVHRWGETSGCDGFAK